MLMATLPPMAVATPVEEGDGAAVLELLTDGGATELLPDADAAAWELLPDADDAAAACAGSTSHDWQQLAAAVTAGGGVPTNADWQQLLTSEPERPGRTRGHGQTPLGTDESSSLYVEFKALIHVICIVSSIVE
jgi:hypothetical protein